MPNQLAAQTYDFTGQQFKVVGEDEVMFQRRWWGMGAVLTAVVLATPLWAVDDSGSALARVPADAPIVVQVRGFERTKDRLVTLVKNAVPDQAAKIQARIEEGLKEGLMGRELKGLVKDGSIFIAFTEMPKPGDDEPALAVIVPVTDFKTFRDGLLKEDERKNLKTDKAGYAMTAIEGKDIYFVEGKGYAVLTPQKEVAVKFTKKPAGLDGKLNKLTAQKLLESDVALYVDMAAVNKEYGDQIKAARPLMEFAMQQAGGQIDKNTQEMMKAMLNGLFQFLEDSRGFLLAGEFRPEGLALHLLAEVGEDTKINAYLKDSKPAALTEVGKLPAGQMGYFAAQFSPTVFKIYALLMQGMIGDGDGKQGKALKEAMSQLAEAGPQELMGDFSMPTLSLQVWKYQSPDKAAAATLKMFQALESGESFGNMPLKEKPVVKEAAQTHRQFKLHSVQLKWDLDKFAEKYPQGGKEIVEAMKGMMGDGSNIWFGTDGKRYVQVTAKDWQAAQAHLDAFLDGTQTASGQKAFQEALKQLPAENTLVGLMDGPQYLKVIAEYMGPMLKGQGVPFEIPPLKADKGKSYFGFALTLRPQNGSADLWMPVTAIAEIRKMVGTLIPGGIQ
jgi:hypothetical protein